MVHWLDALTATPYEIVSTKNNVSTRYIQDRTITIDAALSQPSSLLNFYFSELNTDISTMLHVKDMWCDSNAKIDNRDQLLKLQIDLEEMRAIYGEIGRPSENAYRFEQGLKLRAYHSAIKAEQIDFKFNDKDLRSKILASARFFCIKGEMSSSWQK